MNTISFYQAELDYRREQVRRREQIRLWRRAAAATRRSSTSAQ
jgi:hypothetical protein